MKAALISQGSKSSLMTREAMKKYFQVVDMLSLKHLEVSMGKEGGILYEGKPLPEYDCVYLKGSFRYAYLLRSIAALLEKKVPYMPIPGISFTTVHNKLLTHLVLEQHHIPMPKTYVSSTIDSAKDLLKRVKFPIVMKFPEGTQGKGVMFADSLSSASSLLDALGVLNQPFIIQEYIETGGCDIRALVVGDKVVAAMRRRSLTEDKRANIHAGGKGEPIHLTREVINIALDTAKALQADICGIDILESPTGPLVIEANVSPGLQGIQEVAIVDVADAIANFLYLKTQTILQGQKKGEEKKVMKDMTQTLENKEGVQEIITTLQFRGERILLPEFITQLAHFEDRKEYVIKAQKGKIEVKEFKT
ncbi:RimK family alpha-L-glutamate ligase [Candidatus Woesearchaeota archaeon]|nr:RimK family alpha-L-glutamate ligase [Candidatus Woesearchaeota archaeon]